MRIRTAKRNEVKELQKLNDQIFQINEKFDSDIISNWGQSPAGEKYFHNLLIDKKSLCMVVEEKNELVGYIAVRPMDINYRKSLYCEIENLGVIPKKQGLGIGEKLLKQCIAWAKKNGYKKIYLSSYYLNQKAVKFYEKHEFKPIDISLEKHI